MALGGGVFTSTNKPLPGIYHNFVSAARTSSSLTERGTAAVPYIGDWGAEGAAVEITAEDFWKNSQKLFGYAADHAKMTMWRELFLGASRVYAYRLGVDTVKAQNDYCVAAWGGVRGNDLKTVIRANVEIPAKYDVLTYLETALVDKQTVGSAAELLANDYVIWKPEAALQAEAGIPLTGGMNSAAITASGYQAFLDAVESYAFNALCCPAEDTAVKALFTAYTKRMREETGSKFQTVLFQHTQANYEGVVSLENEVESDTLGKSGLLYWATGVIAGCAVNASNTNREYNGELAVKVDYTQTQLAEAVKSGKFVFHNVSGEMRVLEDINTLTSFTQEKGEDFASNQTIRVLDQIAVDTAAIFAGRYLGAVPNDPAGRISLWNDILRNRQQLQDIRAIEDYDKDSLVIEALDKKRVTAAETIQPVNAMAQLYMTTTVA